MMENFVSEMDNTLRSALLGESMFMVDQIRKHSVLLNANLFDSETNDNEVQVSISGPVSVN